MSESMTADAGKTAGQMLYEAEWVSALSWDDRDHVFKLAYEVKSSRQLQADLAAAQAEVARLHGVIEGAESEFERRANANWHEAQVSKAAGIDPVRTTVAAEAYEEARAHLRALVSRDASVAGDDANG